MFCRVFALAGDSKLYIAIPAATAAAYRVERLGIEFADMVKLLPGGLGMSNSVRVSPYALGRNT
jgi:hypothetical protein